MNLQEHWTNNHPSEWAVTVVCRMGL